VTEDLIPYFENGGEQFEEHAVSNGGRYWYASDFMAMLGYESMGAFQQAINRAIGTCTTLGIPVPENFAQCAREIQGGGSTPDMKLSRFACYLVAMNGDVRKPQVANAQAYFALLAEAAQKYIQSVQDVERVQIRDDISDKERGLASTAKRAGVTEYALFQNAGYRGMYNMDLPALKRFKGLDDSSRTLLDFMDKRELAGNLFRISETDARITSEGIQGQRPAERVAIQVGSKVRQMMVENTGTKPEFLPLAGDIKQVRSALKQTEKELKRLDKPKKKR
jgi:DNA-damage-inducible protein D